MKASCRVLLFCLAACFLPTPLVAQQSPIPTEVQQGSLGENNPQAILHKYWHIVGTVVTLEGKPIPDANVSLKPLVPAERQTFRTNTKGEFETLYQIRAELVHAFRIWVDVKKKEFLPAHELVDCGPGDSSVGLRITLRPEDEDPNLFPQEDLISNLGSRLKTLGPSDGLSAKSAKDYARGAEEFLDRDHADRALGYLSRVVERSPACPKCMTLLALAELDSGDWDGAARDAGKAVILTQKDPGMKDPVPLLMYGVLESWKHNPQDAAAFFAGALKWAPGDSLALQEMGRTEVENHNWEMADSYLSKAIAAGAGSEARLLRVEALLGEAMPDQAGVEMAHYLDKRDVKSMPPNVRKIWDEVQKQKKIKAVYAMTDRAKKSSEESIDYLHGEIPGLEGLVPAKSQDMLKPLLEGVGRNVTDFFRDFQNTTSLEEIDEEKSRPSGKVVGTLDQKFNYLCITEDSSKSLSLKEYRKNVIADQGEAKGLSEGFMLTSGFVSTSLIFHPDFQSESTFRYVGLQKVGKREAYVVAFAQQPLKTQLDGTFRYGGKSVATYTQGLAWIDTRNYQIVRLRTDLLRPLPEARLRRETTEIDYQEVHFKSASEGFWLPRQVVVTVDWNGKLLRNIHRYSDFKLFDVKTNEKISAPKGAQRLAVGQDGKSAQP